MGILDVEHGVLVALLFGKVKIEVERSVVAPHEIEEARDIFASLKFLCFGAFRFQLFTDLAHEVDEGIDVAIALSHRGGLAIFDKPDELEDLDFEHLLRLGQGFFAGLLLSTIFIELRHNLVFNRLTRFWLLHKHGGNDSS